MRIVRYQEIADGLRQQLVAGQLGRGRLLPSEAELAARYGASRVTVRRALELLRGEGLVESRQGVGWYRAGGSVRQVLGRLGTIEDDLAAAGTVPERRITGFTVKDPPPAVVDVLGDGLVLEVVRINLADGSPFARVTVWCPAALTVGLDADAVARASFYDLLPVAIGQATQTISAAAASAGDAAMLELPVGAPVLRCWRVTSSTDGDAVLVSEQVFPAHRTELVVELPRAAPSMAAEGLRLVERLPGQADAVHLPQPRGDDDHGDGR